MLSLVPRLAVSDLGTRLECAALPLQILDHERPVAEVQGKGHAVIPVHTLRLNHTETMREGGEAHCMHECMVIERSVITGEYTGDC